TMSTANRAISVTHSSLLTFFSPPPRPPSSPLFPYTTLFRSHLAEGLLRLLARPHLLGEGFVARDDLAHLLLDRREIFRGERLVRSEEHTSELQSLRHLVCRLLLEKKKKEHKQVELRQVNENVADPISSYYNRLVSW